MNEFVMFAAILIFSGLVRVAIDRRQRKLGRSQIGWIAAVLTFLLLNGLVFGSKHQPIAKNPPTIIGPTEWLIIVGPPLLIIGYLFWRYKLKANR